MKNLIIIGARGFGREVYNIAVQCKEHNRQWTIKGFLDDKSDALKGFNYPVKILSSVEDYEIKKGDVFICALGSVVYKKKYAEMIMNRGGEFISLIHPTAIINLNVQFGKGIIVGGFVIISNECKINDFVTIQGYSGIGHDSVIGSWSHINSYSFMAGNTILEQAVTLHPRATILPKIRIGKDAIVGAGSIVLKNVKEGTTVFGNPAKVLNFG